MNKLAKKENRSPISVTTKKKQILDDVRARYSCEILKRPADEDARISKRIDELALEYLIEVNPDHIAESVFSDLDHLAVEDVWDNSGGTRDGYVDPNELASEMFEEALEPYIDELRKCQELSLAEEAKLRCMGILKGIYKFEKEATTEFQDWAVDDPHENFRHIFEEWVKRNKDSKDLEEMDGFIKKNCPEWYNDLKKSEQYLLR
jgi:hypothetical protein